MWDKASPLLIGLDIGTSGVRAQAFALDGTCVAEGRASFTTRYPGEGRAEQQPADWWRAAVQSLRAVAQSPGVASKQIAGIGLTGQCPTFTCLLPSGETLGPALLYQDNRAVAESEALLRCFGAAALHRRTGQAASPFYVLPKLLWLKGQPGGLPPAGTLIMQPRDLLGWQLTGRCATDPTHAACTLAYDLEQGTWASDWLAELGLQTLAWPEVLDSRSILGYLTAEAATATGLAQGLPVVTGAADSICAAYSTPGSGEGFLCEVTGTSTCLHLPLQRPATHEALNTYPHILPGMWYAEVGLNTTGGALAWLTALLGNSYEQLLDAASTIRAGADTLYFLPHLSGGERDLPARQGAFIGLQLGHTGGHLARALLEGVACALKQRIELLTSTGSQVTHMISCGGGARSPLWAQIKADILGLPVSLVSPTDITAWGAALLAGQTLDLPVTPSSLSLSEFLPDQHNAQTYSLAYERFCQLETLLAA